MSSFMFLGVRNKLNKVTFNVKDIYNVPEIYKNNLWFSDGLLFDKDVIEDSKDMLKVIDKSYYWYEIKGFLNPLAAALRYKDDFPDQYEAALQMSQWFCKFIKKLKEQGNDVCVVRLWIGQERKFKLDKKTLNISKLDLTNYEMPLEIVYNLDY